MTLGLFSFFSLKIILLGALFSTGCQQKPPTENVIGSSNKDYIRKIAGESERVPEALASKGEVLVAYSGCQDCHKTDKRAKGPAFKDIAKRYPVQPVYVDMLARKIITGGFGSWGNPIMSPHPDLKFEDAQTMVYYVLSLKED